MPSAGTVTLCIEPLAVWQGVSWLVEQRPYDSRSLLTAMLPADVRQTRELEYLQRVNRVVEQCAKWLKRTPAGATAPRMETPFEKHNLNLSRDAAVWLGGYWRSTRMGLFGRPQHRRDSAADWFFLSCHIASSKKMGRPTLTRELLLQRTSGEVGEHYQRFLADRRRLERLPRLNALMPVRPRSPAE